MTTHIHIMAPKPGSTTTTFQLKAGSTPRKGVYLGETKLPIGADATAWATAKSKELGRTFSGVVYHAAPNQGTHKKVQLPDLEPCHRPGAHTGLRMVHNPFHRLRAFFHETSIHTPKARGCHPAG
jgi:hypothetical protein